MLTNLPMTIVLSRLVPWWPVLCRVGTEKFLLALFPLVRLPAEMCRQDIVSVAFRGGLTRSCIGLGACVDAASTGVRLYETLVSVSGSNV